MAVNERLRENPRLQRMPQNEREWVHYQNELAKWVLRIAKLGDGTLTTSGGTTVSGLDEMPGQVPSERSLPMSIVGNKSSVQNAASLSASDVGTATVSIASHVLKTPSGDVTYNAGSITGLAFSTKYYIYTDDPTYDGGAVTYLSTTTATDIIGNAGRYYVGEITTGIEGMTSNISGITKGSPTTFTMTAAHGFSNSVVIQIAGIVDDGPGGDIESTFNGNGYVITVGAADDFTVAVDSSSLVNVWASGGTATQGATTPTGGYGGGGGTGDGPIP